ncbi:hypothetical protein A9Q99_11570 [Gammaproteobacteria bacterium 45_16_T64]|nr:hypothetical protein A9Q99_11570 [Gammaproteobacteria bacterium 45_16_T64]
MPSIYWLAFFASLIGLLASGLSFLFSEQSKSYFAFLYFYIPLLWMIWIGCSFKMRHERRLYALVFLWMIINFIPLITLTSFSIGDSDFYNSKGLDFTILVIYAPVILPLVFLFKAPPEWVPDIAGWIGYSEYYGALSIWLEASVLVIVQSFFIVLISKFLARLENNYN